MSFCCLVTQGISKVNETLYVTQDSNEFQFQSMYNLTRIMILKQC